jgi:hypothetical protein
LDNTKTALISIADPHINSTVAVCPKVIKLDDGGTYHSSRTQHWLMECWLDFCAKAKEITEGYKKIALFVGDLTELDRKDRGTQIITPNKATILGMVQDTIAPLVDFTNANYFFRGTAAHTGKSSWSEEAIASDTDNTIPSVNGAYSHWHYRGVASGVPVDIAHHTSMGKKPWTKKNAANNAAAEIMWNYQVDRFVKAPKLALRAHVHAYATSGDNYPCEVNCLPSWTTKTEYAYRVGYENAISDIGGIIYLCENGNFDRIKLFYEPKESRRIWALEM